MLKINNKTKIVDIINEDYTVLSILLRLNVLPGYGEKTIEQLASEANLDSDFLTYLLIAFLDPEFNDYSQFFNFDIKVITSFLKETHIFYKDEKIPELKNIFSKLIESAVVKNNIKIIEHYFNTYLEEFYAHMEYEEKQIFPYVHELTKILETKEIKETFMNEFKKFSIQEYISQHQDSTEEKLDDLKNILLKYTPELKDYKYYYQVISKLYRLGKDLQYHINMENKILIPQLSQMVSEIKKLLSENKIKIVQP
jgi:regulator of cell morphogenesis and NO signaling